MEPDVPRPYSPKRALSKSNAAIAQWPTFMLPEPFIMLLRRVHDDDLEGLKAYFAGRARKVQDEIDFRAADALDEHARQT